MDRRLHTNFAKSETTHFSKIKINHSWNKCSVGPETSVSPREKGQGPTSFSERGLFFSEIGQLSDQA